MWLTVTKHWKSEFRLRLRGEFLPLGINSQDVTR